MSIHRIRRRLSAVLILGLAVIGLPLGAESASAEDPGGWTFAIEQSPSNPVPVDFPITITVTVLDQEGVGVAGIPVEFVRTFDPEPDHTITDAEGVASYVIQPEPDECDSETVTAVFRDPSTGESIWMLNATIDRIDHCWWGPEAGIEGWNSANGNRDVLRVRAMAVEEPLSGVEVELYRKKADHWHRVGGRNRVLDSQGEAVFRVRDRNGRMKSTYKAFVAPTATTQAGETQGIRIR